VARSVARWLGRVQAFAGKEPAFALTVVIGLMAAAAMAAMAASVYDAVSESEGVAGLDRPILDWMISLRTPGLDSAVTDFTDLGGPVGGPLVAGLGAGGLALAWRRWTPLVLMALASVGSLLMTVVGKAVVGRIRPPEALAVPPLETSASFPSGHSLNAVVVVGVLVYLLLGWCRTTTARAALVVGAGAYAMAMGLSRVFLGHHWLTDVLVAWALGLAWLAVVVTGHRVWLLRAAWASWTPQEVSAAAD
jgi:undecaprenyl-diphosphatase